MEDILDLSQPQEQDEVLDLSASTAEQPEILDLSQDESSDVLDLSTPDTASPQKSPDWISEPLTKQDIANIATKYGLQTREQIDSLITQAYLRGGTVEGETRPAQYAVGLASDLLLPGDIPAFAQKKLQADENVRKAMDDISSLVEQKKSTARAVGEVVGGLAVPGLGVAGALGKATRVAGKVGSAAAVGATFGAAGGLAESQEGQEAQGAAIGAGLGAALGAGTGALGKWMTQAAENRAIAIKNRVNTGDTEGDKKLMQMIEEETSSTLDANRAALITNPAPLNTANTSKAVLEEVNTERAEFLKYLADALGEKPPTITDPVKVESALAAKLNSHGQSYIEDAYRDFHKSKVADKYQGLVATQRLTNIQRSLMGSVLKPVEAAMYMVNRVDKATGSHFGTYLNKVSTGLNEYKNAASESMEILDSLIKSTRAYADKTGVSYRELNDKIYKTLDGQIDGEVDSTLIKGWEDFFENLRVLNNQVEGEEVIKRVGGERPGKYVTHTTVDAGEAVEKIQTKIFQLEDTLPQFKEAIDNINKGKIVGTQSLTDSIKDSAAKEDVTDLFNSIRVLNGMEEAPLSLNEALHLFNLTVKNPIDAIRLGEMTAKVSKARKGGTPQLIREMDMAKIGEKYILNTLKQAYIGKDVSRIKGEIVALTKAGVDPVYMKDMADWLQDIQGYRPGTYVAKTNEWMRTASMKARQAAVIKERNGDHAGAKMARAVAASPEVIKFLSDQVYPNTLGIFTNQRSPIKNLFQIFMQTAPEVGYRYAFGTLVKSLRDAVMHPKTAEAWLKENKLYGEMWESFMNSELVNQNAPKAMRQFLSANHKANNVMMYFFGKSEMILRFAAAKLGHKVGNDLVEALGKTDALEFKHVSALKMLDNMLDSERRVVEGLLHKIINSTDAVEKSNLIQELNNNIGQQLIQRTIFDYNKANASIVARSLPAPLLVFTKFPSIVASDIVHKMETKQGADLAGSLMRGYLAPYMIAEIVDQIGEENLGDDNAIQFVLGKEGLSGITSLQGVTGVQGFGNPLIKAPFQAAAGAIKTGAALATGDMEEAEKAATQTGKSITSSGLLYGPAGVVSPARAFYKSILSDD